MDDVVNLVCATSEVLSIHVGGETATTALGAKRDIIAPSYKQKQSGRGGAFSGAIVAVVPVVDLDYALHILMTEWLEQFARSTKRLVALFLAEDTDVDGRLSYVQFVRVVSFADPNVGDSFLRGTLSLSLTFVCIAVRLRRPACSVPSKKLQSFIVRRWGNNAA